MKRILIFSLNYHPFVGGAEVAIKEITDRIEDTDFHLVAYRFDSKLPRQERIGNVTVHRVGFGKRGMTVEKSFSPAAYLGKILYIPLAAVKAMRLQRKERFDAAWAMMSYMVFPLVLMRLFRVRIPYLLTLQEGDPFEWVYERRRIHAFKPLLSYGIRNASAIQAISSFLLAWGTRMGFQGEGRVVPNGVDVAKFAQAWSEEELQFVREKLGKKPGDIFLVTTSRLVHKNGIDTVIAALAHLPEHVHFLIFGVGPLENALKAKAAALKIDDRVHFMGEISHEELPFALAACDIFVRPSRSEGMGNSFIEAMAAGLPVIATQEGGIADFLFDEKRDSDREATGWAVDVDAPVEIAAAVEDILAHPEKTARTIAAAKKLVDEKYDWRPIAQEMKEMFERVASHRSMLKLLIATPLYPPEPGGPATVARLLESELPKRSVSLRLVAFTDVQRHPRLIKHAVYFLKLLREGKGVDVLYALDSISVGLPALLTAHMRRVPLVVRIGGIGSWERATQRTQDAGLPHEFGSMLPKMPLGIRAMAAVERMVLRSARKVIVPSMYMKSALVAFGISEEKIVVIYNGMESLPARSTALASEPVIISAGRFVALKRFEVLITAMATLVKTVPAARLALYGEGPSKDSLLQLVQVLDLSRVVSICSPLGREELMQEIAKSAVFVLPSAHETFSNLIVEAMAVGTPVVSTSVGGTPEIITHGENGLLVPSDDADALARAMGELLENPAQRTELARAATARLERFSEAAVIKGTLNVLEEAVQ